MLETRFQMESHMPAKRGRPVRVAMRQWVNDEAYVARITAIIESRDKTNEETLTNVTYALEVLARDTVPAEALNRAVVEQMGRRRELQAEMPEIRRKNGGGGGSRTRRKAFRNYLTGRTLWSQLLIPMELAYGIDSPGVLLNAPGSTRSVEEWWRRRERLTLAVAHLIRMR